MPAPVMRHDKANTTTSGTWVTVGPAMSTSPPRTHVVGLLTANSSGASDVLLDIAIGNVDPPTAADIVVMGVTVSNVDEYEKRPLVVGPGERIRFRATGTTPSVTVHAFGEEGDA